MTTAYHIKGLGCAACGAKIENAVKNLPGVSHAVVDFANMRRYLDTADIERVRSEISRIDPGVEISPPQEASGVAAAGEEEAFHKKRQIALLVASVLLFGLHAAFEQLEHGRRTFDRTVAHVVVGDRYAGHILIGDRIKPDAGQAVSRLREHGVSNSVMLTGDNECTAQSVAEALGLDGFYAGLLPEDKVRRLWEAVFADMGVAVAAIVNSIRVLRGRGLAAPKEFAPQP